MFKKLKINFFKGNRDNLVIFDLTPETIRTITYAMLNAKTLEGFGGLLRKYCPKRCNQIFTELIKNLLITCDINQNGNLLNREKLVALLTNQIGNTVLYKNEIAKFCWQPLQDVDIESLENIVGKVDFERIEKDNQGKLVLHCYRTTNKNNHNGYGNYNPCMHYVFKFTGYRDRH